MPIYEYQCAKCGHQVEVLQKLSDEPLRRCTACGEDALTKLISETSFQLKGSGWYKASPTASKSGGADVKKVAPESVSAEDSGVTTSTDNKAESTKTPSKPKKDE